MAIAIVGVLSNLTPVMADDITLEDKKAQQEPTTIGVVPGQASPIFFKNDQIIDSVLLSDQSKNIYTPGQPISSGNARSLYLRQIETLTIPGTTTSTSPNLYIETIDNEGSRYYYEFIFNNNDRDRDQVSIIKAKPEPKPQPKPQPEPEVITTVVTVYGEATPEDVQLGLETKIKQNRVDKNEPLVIAIQEYIAQTMNGISSTAALEKTGIPLSVVQQLGALGQEEDTKRRLLPLPQ